MNALADLRFDVTDGSAFNRSIEQGMRTGQIAREGRDRREMRSALAAAAADLDNPSALAAVFERNPELGMKLMDRADERSFNRDLGTYLGGQSNALLGVAASPQGSGQQRNAFAGLVSGLESNAPVEEGSSPAIPPQTPEPGQAKGPDFSFLGQPQGAADDAFLRMLRRDPERALKVRSQLRDTFVDRLAQEQEFYGVAVRMLSAAQDGPAWQEATQRLAPMAQAIGGDLFSVVPRDYPGPEGVQALMERALPVKDRLDFLLREANIDADNQRADRNTDSMIDVRESRAAEYARNNRERSANQRRGQDMTDQRGRARAAARPSRQEIVTVKTPDEARKLKPGTRYRGPDGVVRER